MDIKKSLAYFYNKEARKYYHTRNKHRADAKLFLDVIKKSGKKTVKILEFGCGSGRLLNHLKELKGITIHYFGVDISKELLKFAKTIVSGKSASKNISAEFICEDIITYITGCKQESFDFVFGVASFQHIPTIKERFFLIKNIYRILKYDGILMMINRSFSWRFLKTYTKELLHSLRNHLISGGKHRRNDLMIPWKSGTTTIKRFYHIYTINELKKLIALSGFVIETIGYLKKGTFTSSWKDSQNSLLIAKKSIFLKTA